MPMWGVESWFKMDEEVKCVDLLDLASRKDLVYCGFVRSKTSLERLIYWKNFWASFLLPCISISSQSVFTNSCFFLRNKWRSFLLAVLLVNSTSCSWLQCGLVCIVLLNCCLAPFFAEPCWLLLSTISNLFLSSSVQGVGNVLPQRIDVGTA